MSSTQFRVRRATLDDIGPLTILWNLMAFPADDLAKRITEFQVAETMDGKLAGAVGLEIAQRQGRIHSEAFDDFAVADQVRPLLWDRLHAVATNHGLLRIWTQEQAPFWAHCGLTPPDADALSKMPAVWSGLAGKWLTLKLKEDLAEVISADKEFALFMESEKQRSQRALQQAKILKFIATLLAFGVLIVVLIGAFLIIRRNPQILPH